MLKVHNISKSYTSIAKKEHIQIEAVKPVSFEVCEGQKYALVGESGSGKSTICKMLSGLLPPNTGEILLDEKNIYQEFHRRELYRDMQLVMQNAAASLNPTMNIYNCIAEPLRNLGELSKEEIRYRVYELMQQMELPKELLKRKPRELSGGQQKRVTIARAIGIKPKIIIFDEAVSGLDVMVRNRIMELLDNLQKEYGFAYFFVTHDIDIALYIADQVMVMKEGQIIENVVYNGDNTAFKDDYSHRLLGRLDVYNNKTNKF